MKQVLWLVLLICSWQIGFGQYTLRLLVNEVATKKQEDIYVSGSFNKWDPKDEKYKLKPNGTNRKAIIIKDLPAGKYMYKFTRGGWDKSQTTAKGEDMQNLEVEVNADVSVNHNIDGWMDDFPDKPKPNTASSQVKIIDNAFAIPQLNRTRRIWVYLPKGYETGKKTYPVLYMHDGQNLFTEHTATSGEWGVDEALDTLIKRTRKELIIVAIDNGGDKRLNEYNPYDHKDFGKGEGAKYVEFLARSLKPFIDQKYRTQKESKSTSIAGSSMGGLISMYAIAKYPDVFGSAGIFSPAFWTAPAIFDEVKNANWSKAFPKLFFYAGGKESEEMIPDMDKMIKIVEQKGNFSLRRVMAPLGKHNEPTWRSEFPEFYTFITN